MKTVYENSLIKCRILTEKEAQRYKDMPVELSQSLDGIRSVAVKDNIKEIFELTADGFSRTHVRMDDKITEKEEVNVCVRSNTADTAMDL